MLTLILMELSLENMSLSVLNNLFFHVGGWNNEMDKLRVHQTYKIGCETILYPLDNKYLRN